MKTGGSRPISDNALGRIRKVLALTTSPNPHEAALASEKLDELLAEYPYLEVRGGKVVFKLQDVGYGGKGGSRGLRSESGGGVTESQRRKYKSPYPEDQASYKTRTKARRIWLKLLRGLIGSTLLGYLTWVGFGVWQDYRENGPFYLPDDAGRVLDVVVNRTKEIPSQLGIWWERIDEGFSFEDTYTPSSPPSTASSGD